MKLHKHLIVVGLLLNLVLMINFAIELPVVLSDHFVSLMPGEKRTVEIEINNSDTRGNKPQA